MTERSGAERQPRDQDAGARQHPQPPAAVLAGRPRSLQGRKEPAGRQVRSGGARPHTANTVAGDAPGGSGERRVRVLGRPSGREGEESSVGSGWPRFQRGGPGGGRGARCQRGPGPGPPRPAAPQQPSLSGAEPCPPSGGAAAPGRCPRPVAVQREAAAIHPAPGKEAFPALVTAPVPGKQRGAGGRDRQPPTGNKFV